jgi:hypothetical protein
VQTASSEPAKMGRPINKKEDILAIPGVEILKVRSGCTVEEGLEYKPREPFSKAEELSSPKEKKKRQRTSIIVVAAAVFIVFAAVTGYKSFVANRPVPTVVGSFSISARAYAQSESIICIAEIKRIDDKNQNQEPVVVRFFQGSIAVSTSKALPIKGGASILIVESLASNDIQNKIIAEIRISGKIAIISITPQKGGY